MATRTFCRADTGDAGTDDEDSSHGGSISRFRTWMQAGPETLFSRRPSSFSSSVRVSVYEK
jgi:hypothetical protein